MSIPLNEKYDIEANNDGATETVQWYEGVKYPSSDVYGIKDFFLRVRL